MVGEPGRAGTPRPGARFGYGAAVAAVLLLAGALRFHGLADRSLDYDEAVVALNARGTLSEVLSRTHAYGTSPILFPLALWTVQQFPVTDFSVRFLAAASSLLTVAILLLVLPRVGLGRGPAFFAGSLSALSVGAVVEARDLLVYSADAFVAALVLVALLRFVREGRGALLGLTLFVAPQVQYGLGLFGAAVLAAAAFCPGPARRAESASAAAPIARWFRRRLRLLPFALLLAAGGVLAFALTLRHQFEPGETIRMGHLPGFYFGGELGDPGSVLSFVGARGWEFLAFLLSEPVAAAALGSPVFLVLAAVWDRRRSLFRRRTADLPTAPPAADRGAGKFSPRESPSAARVVLTLGAASLAVAVAAALARVYPLGALRQLIYLGPIVCAAAGVLLWAVARRCSAPLPIRVRPFLAAGAAAALLASGVRAVARADLYRPTARMDPIFAALEDAGPDDLVYVSGSATNQVRYYADGDSAYQYGSDGCYRDFGPCLDESTALTIRRAETPPRIWIVHIDGEQVRAAWRERGEPFPLREAARGPENVTLFVIPDAFDLAERARRERWRELAAPLGLDGTDFDEPGVEGTPLLRARFEVHRAEGGLVYVREPCVPADAAERFFLRLFPEEASGDPAARRDFDFADRGVLLDGKCLAAVPLDLEEFALFRTGQFGADGAPAWEASGPLDPDRWRRLRESLAAGTRGEPAARSFFDLHLSGRELTYHREPCAAEDTEARFFLHLFAPGDPARGGRRRFENRDFDFEERGVRRDGSCVAIARLPAEGVAAVRTGQWVGSEPPSWSASLRVDRARYRERLEEIAAGVFGEPAARAAFDLYLGDAELLYHRTPCAPEDVEARFFLHLAPREAVPRAEREAYGSRSFAFADRGVVSGQECLALFPLDPRRLSTIDTGQRDGGTALWRTALRFESDGAAARIAIPGPEDRPEDRPEERGEPVVRSVFDLFFDGRTITYRKESCSAEDIEARFFLHFVPRDPEVLPAEARTAGFENRDFDFAAYGLRLGGECLARVPAPGYAIDRIVTGQFVSGGGRLWEAAFSPGG